jgi:D-beta-D-heptose 7-phosphate kinase/D-beta-D-heptose 1-phosphate adenosyltransferase
VIVSDYLKGVVSDAVLDCVREAARERGVPVVIDPKRRDLAAYRGATVLTPNRRELANSTGLDAAREEEALRAAEQVMRQTGASILLTQSEKGVTLYRPGATPWHDPAHAQRVRDISGAGDTVAATLALALAAGVEMEIASHMANVAAAVAVGKSGVSLVTPEELQLALLTVHPEQELTGQPVGLDLALKVRKVWRDEGLKVGFTNGCFDLLHPGHVKLLEEARAACDRLIVALNTDASVRRLKGPSRPVQPEAARAAVIGAMRPVDLVVLFDEETPLALIDALQPDVLVKGADYREDQVVGADLVKARGGEVRLVQLVPEQSTTGLIARSGRGKTAA